MEKTYYKKGERLAYQMSGTGAAKFIGALLAAAGVALFVIVRALSPGASDVPIIAVSAFLVILGVLFAGTRSTLVFDLAAGTYEKKWSLYFPVKSKTGSVADFEKVELSKDIRTTRSQHGSHTFAVFCLNVTGPSAKLKITENRALPRARGMSEEIAVALNLPLEDSTAGTLVVRDPERLNESLRERRARTGEARNVVGKPPGDASFEYDIAEEQINIVIPPPPLRKTIVPAAVIVGVFLLVFGIIAFFVLMEKSEGDELRKYIAAGAVVAALAAVAFFLLLVKRSKEASTTLEIATDSLSIRRRGLFGEKAETAFAEEIEGVLLGIPESSVKKIGDKGARTEVIVRTDRKSHAFGAHLPEADKRWLADFVESVLS